MDPAALLRAGSWQPQDQQLLKTVSDVVLQSAQLQHPKVVKLAEEDAGRANSVDSSSTAAGARGEPNPRLMDSAAGGGGGVAGLLPPLRQISLDVIQATVLGREKGLHRQPSERQNIFQDVFNELAGKDETAPLQSGQLYTLPSMQFLESMLSDFDRQATGGALAPLDIPVDAFDLPESFGQSASLRPTPFDQQVQQQHALLMHQHQRAAAGYGAPHRDSTGTASTGYSGFVPMGSAASAPVAMGPLHNSGSLPLANARAHSGYAPGQMAPVVVAPSAALDAHAQHYHLMALQQQQAAYQQQMAVQQQQQRAAAAAALRGPAPPQPAQPRATPRRQSHAYADFEYEEAEVTVQTSKSGRVRKVASFTGVKRRLDVAHAASESRDSRGSVGNGVDSGEVGSKGGRKGPTGPRGKKGRRTVCLNCGCHQTPQWRCGPLGPRTLCNACGVRYKKDLPLNCWPIRDGMVLPPGAVLPPGFVVPPGITIHTQPGDFD